MTDAALVPVTDVAPRFSHSTTLDALAGALAKAQATVKGAKKDAANPFFKTQYADLASTWEACREALTTNGLSVVQFPGPVVNGAVALTTMLLHSSGQWIAATATAPLAKQDAQGVGSAITYLRRYALAAVASVAPADDDGNAASGRAPAKRKQDNSAKGLSEKPAALVDNDDEPLPFEAHTDLNVETGELHEYGELVALAEQQIIFKRFLKAGITKAEFPAWYEKVRGRPFKGLRGEDVEPLWAAVKNLKAEAK